MEGKEGSPYWGLFIGVLLASVTFGNKVKREERSADVTVDEAVNASAPNLTGIPQIDYVHDPNLPRELNGYNLSSYPFYNGLPSGINFSCDGLHDGFYASVPHGCQVYHHCLFGVRYDFLCANYTVFDQKIFNCQFVSMVDCKNSPKFYHRNDELYKTTTTTVQPVVRVRPRPIGDRGGARPIRPLRIPFRRPIYYDYFDYDGDYIYDFDYAPNYDYILADYVAATTERPKSQPQRQQQQRPLRPFPRFRPGSRASLFSRARAPPRIRPPVPINEAGKYNALQGRDDVDRPVEKEATQEITQEKEESKDSINEEQRESEKETSSDVRKTLKEVRSENVKSDLPAESEPEDTEPVIWERRDEFRRFPSRRVNWRRRHFINNDNIQEQQELSKEIKEPKEEEEVVEDTEQEPSFPSSQLRPGTNSGSSLSTFSNVRPGPTRHLSREHEDKHSLVVTDEEDLPEKPDISKEREASNPDVSSGRRRGFIRHRVPENNVKPATNERVLEQRQTFRTTDKTPSPTESTEPTLIIENDPVFRQPTSSRSGSRFSTGRRFRTGPQPVRVETEEENAHVPINVHPVVTRFRNRGFRQFAGTPVESTVEYDNSKLTNERNDVPLSRPAELGNRPHLSGRRRGPRIRIDIRRPRRPVSRVDAVSPRLRVENLDSVEE